jgi:hypothetical protein
VVLFDLMPIDLGINKMKIVQLVAS